MSAQTINTNLDKAVFEAESFFSKYLADVQTIIDQYKQETDQATIARMAHEIKALREKINRELDRKSREYAQEQEADFLTAQLPF